MMLWQPTLVDEARRKGRKSQSEQAYSFATAEAMPTYRGPLSFSEPRQPDQSRSRGAVFIPMLRYRYMESLHDESLVARVIYFSRYTPIIISRRAPALQCHESPSKLWPMVICKGPDLILHSVWQFGQLPLCPGQPLTSGVHINQPN